MDGDLDISLLTRFGEGVSGDDRDLDLDLDGDLERDPEGLLLLEIDLCFSKRAPSRAPRDFTLSAAGERLRAGLLL